MLLELKNAKSVLDLCRVFWSRHVSSHAGATRKNSGREAIQTILPRHRTVMNEGDQRKAACEEASRLFYVYLDSLTQLHKAIDYGETMRSAKASGANIQENLDLAHNAAKHAREAYFEHCSEHGCCA